MYTQRVRRALQRSSVIAWVCVIIAGLRGSPGRAQSAPQWPDPPARVRVRYVASYGESPVSASKGFFASVIDFLFGESDRDNPRLGQPSAVTWSANGDLWVSDLACHSVFRIPATGEAWIRATGEKGQLFGAPVGIGIDRDTVFIVDAETRLVTVCAGDGSFVRSFETGLSRPVSVVVDSARIIIADAVGNSVHVFDHAGRSLRGFGVRGETGDSLHTPTNLVRDGDTLFIVDAMNFRIAVFTMDGIFQRSFGISGDAPGTFSRPRGIACDPDGHLYVVDGLQDCVNIYGRSGEYLMSFGVAGSGEPGKFQLPAGIAIDRTGRIAVADAHNQRVQIFQYVP